LPYKNLKPPPRIALGTFCFHGELLLVLGRRNSYYAMEAQCKN
jgi:hypothetical protein